jgi:hypothetical protein
MRFGFLLVDEFQDTNRAWSQDACRPFPQHLRGQDDAQSIYAFRKRSIRNILDFAKDYLTRNVRLDRTTARRSVSPAGPAHQPERDRPKGLWAGGNDHVWRAPTIGTRTACRTCDPGSAEGSPQDMWSLWAKRSPSDALRLSGSRARSSVASLLQRRRSGVLAYLRILVNEDIEPAQGDQCPSRGLGTSPRTPAGCRRKHLCGSSADGTGQTLTDGLAEDSLNSGDPRMRSLRAEMSLAADRALVDDLECCADTEERRSHRPLGKRQDCSPPSRSSPTHDRKGRSVFWRK